MRGKVNQPFLVTEHEGKFDVTANIQGGGITGQAGALSLAIAKALVELDAANKPALRTNGLVTRDPRMVERKNQVRRKLVNASSSVNVNHPSLESLCQEYQLINFWRPECTSVTLKANGIQTWLLTFSWSVMEFT